VTKFIRIGVDTSKSVFQLHGLDEAEQPVLRKKLRRAQMMVFFAKLEPTRIGMEACGASHHWARELEALGHQVVLLPPQYVKAYLKRGKNDAADAEAICEAMSRPTMRFVPVKSAGRQAAQMLIGLREAVLRDRTRVSNTIRGHAAEFGLVVPKGLAYIEPLLARAEADETMPSLAREMFALLADRFRQVDAEAKAITAKLMAFHRDHEQSRRLAEVPAIGPIGAASLTIKVTDPKAFRSGRDFAAWLGLTPKDHSTAGKTRLGVITRAGDEALRCLLVSGATAVIQQASRGRGPRPAWLIELLKRKTLKQAAVALANKTARIAWKLMVSGECYQPPQQTAAAHAAA
jgi:transposase